MVGRPFRELSIVPSGNGRAQVANFGVQPDWRWPVTFMLPGYNAEPQSATSSFQQLFMKIRRAAPREETILGPLRGRSWLVQWPGYASGGLSSGISFYSSLTYASQIPSAQIAAQAIKDYIDSTPEPKPIVNIIAHSLGCRIALELLESYARGPLKPGIRFSRVVLFAAAVPWEFLRYLGRFRNGACLPERLLVLYSHQDSVLNGPFRVGQTIAKEGFFPQAVGATGRPGGVYHSTVRTSNDHSSYFGDEVTGSSILREFGTVLPSQLPKFVGSTAATLDSVRELPSVGLRARTPV